MANQAQKLYVSDSGFDPTRLRTTEFAALENNVYLGIASRAPLSKTVCRLLIYFRALGFRISMLISVYFHLNLARSSKNAEFRGRYTELTY